MIGPKRMTRNFYYEYLLISRKGDPYQDFGFVLSGKKQVRGCRIVKLVRCIKVGKQELTQLFEGSYSDFFKAKYNLMGLFQYITMRMIKHR